ncbi:MAG TPA: tyrosine-type recombinase/integrase [Solirubrobacterales bacterium]|nr:tyrosine-type recombinase/integrase [Solirubrobacterales bacterium]
MAKLTKTNRPGIFRRHAKGCNAKRRCDCPYVVVSEHRGKQYTETFRTAAEAQEAQGTRKAGDRRPKSKVRFGDYFAEWIESYSGRTKRGFSETTRPEYRRPINAYAVPKWGTWKLAEIEPADVRELFGSLRRDERTTSQIMKLRAALSTMFATAVEDNLVRSNPCQGVRIPATQGNEKPDDDRAKALTRKELGLLLAALPDNWQFFFEFLAATGLRIGEAVGLTWEHIDLGEQPHVKVREQVYERKRRKLKSGAGRRDVPLSASMAARLLARRRDGYRGSRSPVFPSRAGTPLSPGNVYRRVLAPSAISIGFAREVVSKSGKTRTRSTISFHVFRHTCASLLFEEGRNVKQVADWLGHTDPGFTLRTYVHLLDAGLGGGLDVGLQVNVGSRPGQGKVQKQPQVPTRPNP